MATIDLLPSGRVRARVRRGGISVVNSTFRTRNDAKKWARETESAIEQGTWKDPTAPPPPGAITLRGALDKYERKVTAKKRSAPSERSVLRIIRRDAGYLLDLSIADIAATQLANLRDRWEPAVAPSTIRRRLALISHLYVVARKDWGVPGISNPVEDVRQPLVDDARERRVSETELKAICAVTESRELTNFLRLALATTMRRGEMKALRWEDVSLRDRTAWLPAGVTKGSKGRFVPLSTAAIAVIKGMGPKASGPLFHYDPHTYTRAWRRAVNRARASYIADCAARGTASDPNFLVDLRLHDLRHEGASRYAEKRGFNTIELSAITGHKDLRMLKRYTHPDAKELAKRMG